MTELHYAYETVDDEGVHNLILVGPITDDVKRKDGWDWEEPLLVAGPHGEPLMITFVTAFDHSPSEAEIYALIPEKYAHQYAERFADLLAERDYNE